MLDAIVMHPPACVALREAGRSWTYGELAREVDQLADHLTRCHFRSGGALAIDLPDSAAWVVADLACLMARIPCVPIPSFFTHAQREHACRSAGVTLLLQEAANGSGPVRGIAGRACTLVATGYRPIALPAGTAKITYTSGTTGTPKGVCLSEDGMRMQAETLRASLGEDLIAHHRSLLPFAVLLENVAGLYIALLSGAELTLGPVVPTPHAMADALLHSEATSCILVPGQLAALVASGAAFPHLRYAAVGGAPVSPRLLQAARAQGIPAYEGYGLSEACSVVALNLPGHDKPGTCGRPLPHATVHIAGDGEVLLDDPLFLGYLGEGAPASPFATGDIGALDEEGFLRITGRKKNIIITSYGRNFSPEWVEGLLTEHPAIAQAVVYGDARPFNCAVIVTNDAAAASRAVAEANAALPGYARVAHFITAHAAFTAERGEMTPTGKPDRRMIYKHYAESIEALYEKEVA